MYKFLEDLFVHAALVDLKQPLEVDFVFIDFLLLWGGLAIEEVVHHEFHLFYFDYIVLYLLALCVLILNFVACLSPHFPLEVVS